MIALFGSNWKLALEIVIVVAVLVALAVFDPFKVFDFTPRLQDTPLSVKSIKDIGELTTAEYYGEVVASLKEAEIEEFEPAELNSEATALTDSLVAFLNAYKDKKVGGWFGINLAKRIYDTGLPQHPFYAPYMRGLAVAYIAQLPKLNEERKKQLDKNKGNNQKEDEINNLLDVKLKDIESELLPLLHSNLTDESKMRDLRTKLAGFPDYFKKWKLDDTDSSRRTRRADVVFIGRGWVKAGFRFDEFNASNFRYDSDSKTIFIKNLDPVLLDVDINPWFIPERKVPGFELIRATGKARNERAVNKTKAYCKEKLKRQAMERDILKIAKDNARESLKQLFSLLLDTEINDVIFTSEYYTHYLAEVRRDSVIDLSEAHFLDSTIALHKAELTHLKGDVYKERYAALQGFIKGAETMQVRSTTERLFINGGPYNFNKYTGTISNTMLDGIVDSTEWQALRKLYFSDYTISEAQTDTLWFDRRITQRQAFVNSMDVLSSQIDSLYNSKMTNVQAKLEQPGLEEDPPATKADSTAADTSAQN